MDLGGIDAFKILLREMNRLGWFRGGLKFLLQRRETSRVARGLLKICLTSDNVFEKVIDRLAADCAGNLPPHKVYAESTNACNAKCVMCPRDEMTRKIGIMELEQFKEIVDQSVAMGVRELRFHNYGEVMMDPRLGEKITYAKQAGIPMTALYTNGSLLNPTMGQAILEAGLDKMFVSIDGTDRESFERIRLRLKYDQVVGNLRSFLELRHARGLKKPYTEIVVLPIESSNGAIEEFKKRWEGVADRVRVSVVHDFSGQGTDQYVSKKNAAAVAVKRIPCYMPWRDMYLLWNGDVTLCCLDFDGKHRFGNSAEKSLLDIWQGEEMQQLRDQHLTRRWDELSLCSSCHVNVYWDFDSKIECLRNWL
ncbi:MAG: radical SAM/SPASM domain-containing protein [bacterium]